MYFSKFAKKVLAVAVAVAVTASSVVATPSTKKADAASYKAYLCLQTAKFTFRNQHDDAKFSNKLQNTTNKLSKNSVKFKDTTMKKGKKTYTVQLTGLNKCIAKDKTFNTLYVDTNIKGKDKKKVTVTNVNVFFDGKKVKTIKKGVLTPDPGQTDGFVQLQIINMWNSRVAKFKYTMPKKTKKVTYTVKIK